jgi:hypothetical protein
MSKKFLEEIEALKKRIAELEARPVQVHYHTNNHYYTNPYIQPIQPFIPQWPQSPYPWIATSGGTICGN